MKYFLCNAVKEKLYADRQETFELLKFNILDAIAEIRPHTLEKVHRNWFDRLRYSGQPRQPYKLNNIPFLIGTIVFHSKKK